METVRRGRAWLIGIACAGIALSHEFGYQVDNPAVAQRVHVLQETGHAYLPVFVTLALIACILGIVGYLAHRVVGRTATSAPRELFLHTALYLFGLQAAGFVILEVGERALSGSGSAELLAHSPVIPALLAQGVLALLGALLLFGLARSVDAILSSLERSLANETADDPPAWLHKSIIVPAPILLSGGRGLRGPPSHRR
ncbi:MAG: hypothetical protein ACRDLB_01290 [Actinomycetota bacterium]